MAKESQKTNLPPLTIEDLQGTEPHQRKEKGLKDLMKTIKTKQCKGESGNVLITERAPVTKSKNMSKNRIGHKPLKCLSQ